MASTWAGPRRLLEALEPDSVERRCLAVGDPLRQHGSGPTGGLVLLVVGPRAVPVLEVDPEVLDRLTLELGQDPTDQVLVAVEHVEELRAVLHDGHLGVIAVPRQQGRIDLVGRHVERVHRLAAGPLTGVVARERGVGVLQPVVDLGRQCLEVDTGALRISHARTLVGCTPLDPAGALPWSCWSGAAWSVERDAGRDRRLLLRAGG
jgi:hypothetical protein